MELSELPSAEIRSIPAKVPGSVQWSLREAGLLPDWNVDENWRLCEWVEHRHWIYETDLPAEWLREGAQSRLVCLGLDYQGMIMLNGEIIGEFKGTHIPHDFDLTPHLADGRNTLRIIFDLPPRWLGQFGFTSKVTEWKTRFNYTWDWMPRLVQTGIWDGIYLEVGDGREIGAVAIDTDVNLAEQSGLLTLRGGIDGYGQGKIRVALYDGGTVIRSEKLSGSDYAAHGLDWTGLPVQLWWPNGEGDQPLYDLAIELLDDDGQKIDGITRRVGFRNVAWAPCEGAPGGADPWLCVVNGRPVFLQGVNFPPLLPNYADVTGEMHRQRIDTYRDLGLNIFRINGVGYLESETFYNLCDEAGIMVWQDVPLSSSGVDNYPPEDETTIREVCYILESFIERRRHHPSLIVWCGGNELQKVNADGLSVPVDETHPLVAAMARVAQEKDPRRRFLATTATGPRFYAQPEDFGKGLHWDVHGPWKIAGTMDDWRHYWENDDALFRSEAGCPGASPEALIRRYADRLDPMPVSVDNPMWRRPLTWWIEDDAFRNEKGRDPETLAEYVEWSQARQLEALVIAIRACRSRFPQCGGIMLWCGHDCFPCATNTSILDFDGNPKPAAGAFRIAAGM
jgi:beta-mannosidase